MPPLSLQDLRAPYEYVATADHLQDVTRLLEMGRDGSNSTSITLAALGKSRSIVWIAGLGSEIWAGIDPVEYVRGMRDEWGIR